MHRLPFYDIKPEAYLFSHLTRHEGERNQNEEPVRQWCAFELIRAYGIPVTNLVLEHPVKVASKKYGIDILVLRNGTPWIVIECKHREYTGRGKALEQAISYANSEQIRAEFVLYTNGREWIVQRRVQSQWTPVVDLPRQDRVEGRNSLLEVLRMFDGLLPMLHVLDQPVEGTNAKKFLHLLQIFFNGKNHLAQGVDDRLRWAMDNLLRVISSDGRHLDYNAQKLGVAHSGFEQYRKERGIGFEIDFNAPSPHPTYQNIRSLQWGVGEMANSANALFGPDPLILRLAAAVLSVGEEAFHPTEAVSRISPTVHRTLRDFLSYSLAVYLDLSLPDPVDHGNMSDLRTQCSGAWDDAGDAQI